jgi:spermidine synthase
MEGDRLPETHGFFDGQWWVEQHFDAARISIRVSEKLHEEQSAYQKIAVYDSPFFGKVLTLDDLMMLTERDEFVYHELLVHVPLCAHPEPRNVLIIGGGDCGCAREVLKHESVERVVQCDIDERVTRVSEQYFDWVSEVEADPRVELLFDDGIRYIERNRATFDLVIVDSTDPKGPAVGLFLRDFYEKVALALKPGGIMTAQTESPMWDPGCVGPIFDEIRAAFQYAHAYLGWVPVYPSGCWSLAWASNDRDFDEFFDEPRAAVLEESCRYYNRAIHRAAFALPNFARSAVRGHNIFAQWDERLRRFVGHR